MMEKRVVRLEAATYEVIEAEHSVEALTKAFKGAKVVCNTVGPFVTFGLTAVEAALKAGCHHIDTTGEHSYVREVRDRFGELYARSEEPTSELQSPKRTSYAVFCIQKKKKQ